MKRKVDELGRIVIPKEIREDLNINHKDKLKLEVIGNKIIITKVEIKEA